MRRYCWSVVLATTFLLSMFACAVSSDTPDDGSESGESAVWEGIAESELGETCKSWICVSVHPSGCEGYGLGPSRGRCLADARNSCNANCGPGCSPATAKCDD